MRCFHVQYDVCLWKAHQVKVNSCSGLSFDSKCFLSNPYKFKHECFYSWLKCLSNMSMFAFNLWLMLSFWFPKGISRNYCIPWNKQPAASTHNTITSFIFKVRTECSCVSHTLAQSPDCGSSVTNQLIKLLRCTCYIWSNSCLWKRLSKYSMVCITSAQVIGINNATLYSLWNLSL